MDDDRLGKRLLAGAVAGCVLLTLVFVAVGFPYDRLADRIVATLERSTGAQLEYADFRRVLTWAGPVLEWQGVVYRDENGKQLDFDHARLRAGWSPSWLVGNPAVHVDLMGPAGRVVGLAIGGDEPGFDGRLEQITLEQLPSEWLDQEIRVAGVIDGEVDVRVRAEGLEGSLRLEGRQGSVSGGLLGMMIPFDQLSAHLSLGGDHGAEIETLRLEGPLLRADVTGTVGTAPTLKQASLDLVAEIDADAGIVQYLQRSGIVLAGPGASTLSIGGTAGAPQVR